MLVVEKRWIVIRIGLELVLGDPDLLLYQVMVICVGCVSFFVRMDLSLWSICFEPHVSADLDFAHKYTMHDKV